MKKIILCIFLNKKNRERERGRKGKCGGQIRSLRTIFSQEKHCEGRRKMNRDSDVTIEIKVKITSLAKLAGETSALRIDNHSVGYRSYQTDGQSNL